MVASKDRRPPQSEDPRQVRILAKTDRHCWYCGERVYTMYEIGQLIRATNYQECMDAVSCPSRPDDTGYPVVNLDHKLPTSRGGGDEETNMVPACASCNSSKYNKTPDEFKAWRVERGLMIDGEQFHGEVTL